MSAETSLHEKRLAALAETFASHIPFNQVIGLHFRSLSTERCELVFKMDEKLVGNYVQGILHGGVIATALDVAGGTMAAAGLIQKHGDASENDLSIRLSKLGTIDLRIDYLRPGRGQEFCASATLLRAGNKVAVARMELHNENQELIAGGSGTYLVG